MTKKRGKKRGKRRWRRHAKALWALGVVVAGLIFSLLTFLVSPGFQEYVCGWPWLDEDQVSWLDEEQVRDICQRETTWTATPAEFAELTDDFLAVASGAAKTEALDMYSDDPPSEEEFLGHWEPVIWAQRVGDLRNQEGNAAVIRYERYEVEAKVKNVPPGAVVKIRDVDVRVRFNDDGVLQLVSWSGESRPNDAADDHGVRFPRVLTVADTQGYVLPSPTASHGSLLPTEDTVRLICRLDAPDRDWTRTTDGWVPTDTLPDLNDAAPDLAACQPHHAERAAALEAAA